MRFPDSGLEHQLLVPEVVLRVVESSSKICPVNWRVWIHIDVGITTKGLESDPKIFVWVSDRVCVALGPPVLHCVVPFSTWERFEVYKLTRDRCADGNVALAL